MSGHSYLLTLLAFAWIGIFASILHHQGRKRLPTMGGTKEKSDGIPVHVEATEETSGVHRS
jgi:hypothetical protein